MALPHRSVCVLLLAAVGCGGEEPIRTYSVPREPESKRVTYRILGALYPADKPVWYFKLTGSADDLAKHEADWEKLIASVKYKNDTEVPEFALPAGWIKTGPRTKGIVKTDEVIKVGSKESPLEVTITLIADGPESGLKANLARWANQQLGGDYEPDKLESLAAPFEAAGGKGLRVDLRGPKNPAAGSMMGKMR